MSFSNFIILGVLETFLVLQLIDKAYSSETSYSFSFPLWIIGVIIGGIILIVVVIIIIIITIKKYNNDRAKIAARKRLNTIPTQTQQQQQPVIGSQPQDNQPYSTGYNNNPNPNSNPNLYPNPDPTLPLPIKTNNEFMY